MGIQMEGVSPLEHEGYMDDVTGADGRTVGWRAGCVCGWGGTQFYADDSSSSEELNAVYDEVYDQIWTEWTDQHMRPSMHSDQLQEAGTVLKRAHQRVADAVTHARRDGTSWTQIGHDLGMSRQAAWERWHHLDHS